ncbi:redoxin domain-containing protein [Haloferula rosea]|uniref:thioredoxin-dependent peroxiredoxin n=1 Tax=Haloferula rosea TaxID=490093 RepID=A0A934RCG2_9BACT|nr:redoxin domain-containing protein [Haloferula rosea]MBK1828592.1 redoxin domain-containing protein [Haloferula rosea]
MLKQVLLTATLLAGALGAQSLNDSLEARKDAFLDQAPAELLASQNRALRELEESGIYEKVLKVGDRAPDFSIKNQDGEDVRLSERLEHGPVVLTWYRGAWCPYCNITLAALADTRDEMESLGAQLMALTPELPQVTTETTKDMKLGFDVLTDLNHQVAEQYGLVFRLNDETAKRYEEKFELIKRSGAEAANRLPLPATYLVSQSGIITYAFVDADYRRRAEPSRILDALKALRDGPSGTHMVQQFWENTWNPPYDLDLIDHLMTEDFVITSAGRDVTGRHAFKQWVKNFQTKARGLRLENREIFPSEKGDRVVSRWIARANNGGVLGTKADHQPIEFTGIAIWEMRDGKLAHNWVERSAWEMFQSIQKQQP